VFTDVASVKDCACNSTSRVFSLELLGGYTSHVTLNKGITLLNGGQLAGGYLDTPGGADGGVTGAFKPVEFDLRHVDHG
jgi:hypothetical protein